MYFLVGCTKPILLRRKDTRTFEVVSDCFLDHLETEAAVLGPLPTQYRAQLVNDPDDWLINQFYDASDNSICWEDPRMPELPSGWEIVEPEAGEKFQVFKNTTTSEVTKQDPRFSYDAFKARGLNLQILKLA